MDGGLRESQAAGDLADDVALARELGDLRPQVILSAAKVGKVAILCCHGWSFGLGTEV